MKILKSISHHISDTSIFVLAVSLAAVAHSSWTFSTILGGDEPADLGERIPWIIIGLFLAFSLDIGLLALSGEIRHGKRSLGRYVAFVVLAAAMAYLQTVFCLTHAPVLTLSKAVRLDWIPSAQLILDLAIFITPALLPVAIVLHTFSGEKADNTTTAQPSTTVDVDGRTYTQHEVNHALETVNEIMSIDLPPEVEITPESEGEAVAVRPLPSSNGHRRSR